MNKRISRSWRKFKLKINSLKINKQLTIMIAIVVLIIIVVSIVLSAFANYKKTSIFNKISKEVNDFTLKYVENNYKNVENNTSLVITLADLENEFTFKENISDCEKSSLIEYVKDNNGKVNVKNGLKCKQKKSKNKIESKIKYQDDDVLESGSWSKTDLRITLNENYRYEYKVVSLSDATLEETYQEAVNNNITLTNEGYSYISLIQTNNDNIKSNILTPVYRIDKTPPVMELEEATISIDKGQGYNMPVCQATDNLAADKLKCEIIGELDIDKVGSYPLNYVATDLAGNKTMRNITIIVKSPLLTSVLTETIFTGNPNNNFVSFNNEVWRIISHDSSLVKMAGPSLKNRVFDDTVSKENGKLDGYNTWSTDKRRYGDATSKAKRALDNHLGTIAKVYQNMIKEVNGSLITTLTLNDWQRCRGLNVTDEATWGESYSPATFLNENCFLREKNNISYWTMTPVPNTTNKLWRIVEDGSLGQNTSNNKFNLTPVIYLDSNVKVLGGQGTSANPYVLGQ